MNDQVLQTLRAAGFDVRPTATLDREGAFFALTEDVLYYLEGQKASSVNLRDITRIHSDGDGILRVKSGVSTVITAPLAGFEVPRVQHFFAEVRHATARAKTLPAPPSPAGASPWKTGWNTNPEVTSAAPATPDRSVEQAAPPRGPLAAEAPAGSAPKAPLVREVVVFPSTATTSQEPDPSKPPEHTTARPAGSEKAPIGSPAVSPAPPIGASAAEAVRVISNTREGAGSVGPAVTSADPPRLPVREPIRISSAPASVERSPAPTPAASTPTASTSTASTSKGATSMGSSPVSALASAVPAVPADQSATVEPGVIPGRTEGSETETSLARYIPTLRLLAVLIGVAGAGVGLLELQAGAPLRGFWTIGVGAVGAVALFIFGEVVRTVAQMADLLTRQAER